MKTLVHIVSPWLLTLAFWLLFGACVDHPAREAPPIARIVTSWDPLSCGPPHRVVLELEDEAGAKLSGSMPCNAGGLALDTDHFGIFRGRIYATELDPSPIELWVDKQIYEVWIGAPP